MTPVEAGELILRFFVSNNLQVQFDLESPKKLIKMQYVNKK